MPTSLARVPVNTNLTIIARQGGWYHVRLAQGQDGWLPMTSLRLNGADYRQHARASRLGFPACLRAAVPAPAAPPPPPACAASTPATSPTPSRIQQAVT